MNEQRTPNPPARRSTNPQSTCRGASHTGWPPPARRLSPAAKSAGPGRRAEAGDGPGGARDRGRLAAGGRSSAGGGPDGRRRFGLGLAAVVVPVATSPRCSTALRMGQPPAGRRHADVDGGARRRSADLGLRRSRLRRVPAQRRPGRPRVSREQLAAAIVATLCLALVAAVVPVRAENEPAAPGRRCCRWSARSERAHPAQQAVLRPFTQWNSWSAQESASGCRSPAVPHAPRRANARTSVSANGRRSRPISAGSRGRTTGSRNGCPPTSGRPSGSATRK